MGPDLNAFKRLISKAFLNHAYLVTSSFLDGRELKQFQTLVDEEGDQGLYEESLALLTEWLAKYHQKRVILLIDEYDTPAHTAYVGGYYNDLIAFLRSWLSSGLKDNRSLEKGVLTAILRIAKESVFSGLNNINTCTLLTDAFQDKFGLTGLEVRALVKQYDLEFEP